MQSVNNDMDDLFRQAAENYPLNTDGSDWDKVLEGLEPGRRKAAPERVRELERYFWMAAIFLVVICTTFIQKNEPIHQPDSSFTNTDANTKVEMSSSKKELTSGQVPQKSIVLNHAEKNLVHNKKPDQAFIRTKKAKSPFLIPSKENAQEQQTKAYVQDPNKHPVLVNSESITKNLEQITPLDSIRLLSKDKITVETGDLSNSEKERFAQKIYTAFIAGPDVTTVKSQKVNSPGYSVGLLVGYQFSKSFSLETGVLWGHKDYYSEGKHFNKSGLGLPQHAKILDVNGYCDMFEIPFNVKFNWVKKSNYNLFATAGASSYLMKKEKYDYSYDYYGTQYKYYKKYNNASRDWTSILNLSIGFEKKIGNAGSFRLEPYMKLPLRGVGIGDLPMSSNGVFIGFSRTLR
ncbi:PorT family protein [Chitinophagaceae bacterium LB-8]|uniref:PorT family protein n=1 Tax=Paraflavisolibacter caeni TaxID=2982496 RepID=A0A9X3BHE8_9BACT|nr:outer membrane beta-barrel protein [Paraflavisolibacter caeni]MCU7549472.1 PorT family protein [Paraflavisolibacter caeni]